VAALFQTPTEPLPYLFLYGGQDTGKSTFHEALSLLLLGWRGYVRADNALISQSGFNGELLSALLCVIEEIDLSKSRMAYARIKDWVTGPTISIHAKGQTPYEVHNTCHWVQCANEVDACPIFPGDTRITMVRVECPEVVLPKKAFFQNLQDEAPAFLEKILTLELPETESRLKIPVLETEEKLTQKEANLDVLSSFLEDRCYRIEGSSISFADFYSAFTEYCPPDERRNWPRQRVSRNLPISIPRGKMGGDGSIFIGNISLKEGVQPTRKLIRIKNRLIRKE
jgi:phage/plasmid-associated DNA primase